MPKFMIRGSYSAQGNKGVISGGGGTARRKAVAAAIEGGGGKLEAFYWALGPEDFYLILEAPNNSAVAAVSMAVMASGAIEHCHTTPLLTAEEVDAAAKLQVSYKAPGQ
ncbi:MAG TPA: GYD domain-containing protein [Candidatus Eremiobacteraceae bacterium]|nr:GYD domain-containing protein [Candidatus Eremiobacteraceae bacterium]